MTDVVYILGTQSKWCDFELLHSMRSVKMFLKNYDRIVVFGARPQFFPHVVSDVPFVHIPAEDTTRDKQHNVRRKLLELVKRRDVSSEFLLMNDDFFFLEECDAETYPYYKQGELLQHIEWRRERPSAYLESLELTHRELRRRLLRTTDFEIHAPIRYRKDLLHDVLTKFDWDHPRGLLIRSLYGNYANVDFTTRKDCKVDAPCDRAEIERRIAGADCFSIGDAGLNDDMKTFLVEKYPPHGWLVDETASEQQLILK